MFYYLEGARTLLLASQQRFGLNVLIAVVVKICGKFGYLSAGHRCNSDVTSVPAPYRHGIAAPSHPRSGRMQPICHGRQQGAKVGHHAPFGGGAGVGCPRGHAVHRKAVQHDGFAR